MPMCIKTTNWHDSTNMKPKIIVRKVVCKKKKTVKPKPVKMPRRVLNASKAHKKQFICVKAAALKQK